jgi:RNA polymerase sigma-70 factor (ECF subfamily)
MQEIEDGLFRRWCRHGDTRALGELFDSAGPRLLKLAIHLAGDIGEAEDLVQATFLVAIEQRASVDPTRPVMPWLSGVLANKARAHLRQAARAIDPERLVARAEPDAAQPLEHRELDGAVAKAIDRLGEPYRQVLVLRLRHGLEVGDIAHVLERDSGTVRVQLHRGLGKLRELLPAALATSLFLGLVTSRGLAAVRAQVLREGAAAAAAISSTSTLGGLILTKQVLIAAAAAAVIAAFSLFPRPSGGVAIPGAAPEQQARATKLEPDAGRSLEPAKAPVGLSSADEVGREAVQVQPTAEQVLRGVVVDARTNRPIAGATLSLFEPREAFALDLVRERPGLYEAEVNGRLRARTMADWPLVVGRVASARVGRQKVLAYDRPREGEEPIDETISGSDGSFALDCGPRGGVIECSSGGYATRWRPVRDLHRETTIALWGAREVRGVVVGPDGNPVIEPLELVFSAIADPPAGQHRPWSPGDGDEVREALGAWSARTTGDGRFSVELGAPRARVSIATPGWSTIFLVTFEPDQDELTIRATRMPVFHFFDAATDAPIERVRLLGRDQRAQYVRWSGEYLAPNGVLQLPGDATYAMSHDDSTLAFVAWSDGYAPANLSVARISSAGTIEVPMEAGSANALDGVVRRGAEPLAGAEVALIGHSPLQWRVDADWIVDAATTDSAGRFHLGAPQGSYLLRVRTDDAPFVEFKTFTDPPGLWFTQAISGREPYFEQVDVPPRAPLDIDLGRSARIEVEITDTLGVRQVDHTVGLRDDDGRQVTGFTDENGLVRFANLPPGAFKLHTPKVNTRGSYSGGELREVELDPGETERVRIEIPANTGPRQARVVARDVLDYTGWKARYDADPWQALGADGTVPMDLATQAYALDICSPAGRRWHLPIPKDAPDGTVIELDLGNCRYKGELLHGDGTPWQGVRVHAAARGECPQTTEARPSCVTDARGVFELEGLASCAHRLRFQTQAERYVWDDWKNVLAGVSFEPGALPSESPDWLTIRVSDRDAVHVRGSVRRANGERLANAQLVFQCTVPQPDGALSIGGERAFTHTDERGEFDVELPRTPGLSVRVYTSWTADGLALTQSLNATEAPIELIVP